MNQNKVLDKIQEFATTDISLDRFKELLRSSNSSNKMRIKQPKKVEEETIGCIGIVEHM